MSPFFPSNKKLSAADLLRLQEEAEIESSSTMCNGQAFHFESCGHIQSVYSTICLNSQSSKENTSCDRLQFAGVKPGVCSSCVVMDEKITKLKAELKAKEAELNQAILARGDKTQPLSTIGREFELRGSDALIFQPRDFLRVKDVEGRSSGRSSFNGVPSPLKIQAVPRKTNSLVEDIKGIVKKWHKERSGYQATLDAFQVRSLGAISFKDVIAKCDLTRDELMKARFKLAEEELAKKG